MTNEKDMEIKVYRTNKNGYADHCHAEYVLKEDHDAFVAEAVKAERKRCAARSVIWFGRWITEDHKKSNPNDDEDSLFKFIVSDDQEARNG